jgi:hypothetical protein
VCRDLLRVAAAVEQADHPRPAVGAADELGARDQRQFLRGQVAVLRLVRVGVVDAGGAHREQPLAGTRLRLGDVDDLEDLGTAEAGDLHGSHGREARRRRADVGIVTWVRDVAGEPGRPMPR